MRVSLLREAGCPVLLVGALTQGLSVSGFSPESGQVFFGVTACLSQVSVRLVADAGDRGVV